MLVFNIRTNKYIKMKGPTPAQGYQTDLFKDPPEGSLINGRFVLRGRIGRGSFGCVFKGN
jgi:hypothetical protein